MRDTTEALVIGAGVIGSSIALDLVRRGLNVTVVDKAAGPGLGSTSASSAIVRFNYSGWDAMAAAWESKFGWEDWEKTLGFRDPDGMARYVRCGMVMLDVDILPRTRMVSMFGQAGIPFEVWDTEELAARVPGLDPGRFWPPKPVTSEEFFDDPQGVLGAVYTPDAGYVTDPQQAAANLAAAARSRGARFAFREDIVAIARPATGWRLTCASGRVLEADVVVNAAGPWSARLNKLAGVGSDWTVHTAPLRQEVHVVAAPDRLTRGGEPVPCIADVDLGTYLRGETGGNLLVGGTEPACDPLEWVDDPDVADPRPSAERFQAQVWRAARRLPELSVPNRPRGVAGVYDVSDDWTPIYDRTEAPGFFVAIGTSGNQFKNAPLVGALMGALIEGVAGGHDHDADPLAFTAPHTGHVINLGAFSRRRARDPHATGTVMG